METLQQVRPEHLNHYGYLFGGYMLMWVDEDYLDVDNYADYLITNFYGGNSDWPHKNYYAGRLRGPDSPFRHGSRRRPPRGGADSCTASAPDGHHPSPNEGRATRVRIPPASRTTSSIGFPGR